MPLVYSWFFWITIIGILMALIGGILIFATDLGYIAWIVTGVGILLLILGIIFWIRDARKPKKKQSLIDKVKSKTPGLYEFSRFEDVTGLGDTRRRVQQYGIDTTKSVGRGIKRAATSETTKSAYRRFRRDANVTGASILGGLTLGPVYGGAATIASYYYGTKGKNKAETERRADLEYKRNLELANLQLQASQQQQSYPQYQGQQFIPQQYQGQQFVPQYQGQQFIPQQYTQQPQYIQY